MKSMYYYVRPDTLRDKGIIAAIQEEYHSQGEPMFELPPHQPGFVIIEVKAKDQGLEAEIHPTEMADLLKSDYIDFSPDCLGGRPRLEGHRISVGQLVGELLDEAEEQIKAVAENFDLDPRRLKRMYEDVAHFFDQPWGRTCAKLKVPPQDHGLIVKSFTIENRTFTFDSPKEVRVWTYHGAPKQIVAEFRDLQLIARGCGQNEEEAVNRLYRDVARWYDFHPEQIKGRIAVTSID